MNQYNLPTNTVKKEFMVISMYTAEAFNKIQCEFIRKNYHHIRNKRECL